VGRVAKAAAPFWCAQLEYRLAMIDQRFFDDLGARISEALRDSPVQDVEKNLRALLAAWFDRLDLVMREDFDAQQKLLERAQAKLTELEARIAELEAKRPPAA
jgi:BMFP domain-containing protein YqiC